MSLRALSVLAVCAAVAPAIAWAQTPKTQVVAPVAASTDAVGAHAAIAQAQERLAEIDASITVLQEDADKVQGAARQRAHDAVASLRTLRETYRKEIDGVVAQGRQMTADQLTAVRAALTAPWTQFEQALDQDVAAVKLDATQRKALVEARIKAAEQRAAIDARIARVRARADEAQARLTKLAHAGQSAWSVLKQGFVNSRQIFDETYRGTR